jgi:hypothetical protein
MSTIILADRRDEQKVISEEKEIWVYNILVALGADEDILAEIKKEDMSEYLSMLELEVWNKVSGEVDIFRKGKLVAQWKQPILKLIKKVPKYYYEIHLNEWALPFQMQSKNS